jgi:hypothetical protein
MDVLTLNYFASVLIYFLVFTQYHQISTCLSIISLSKLKYKGPVLILDP